MVMVKGGEEAYLVPEGADVFALEAMHQKALNGYFRPVPFCGENLSKSSRSEEEAALEVQVVENIDFSPPRWSRSLIVSGRLSGIKTAGGYERNGDTPMISKLPTLDPAEGVTATKSQSSFVTRSEL